MAGLSAAGLEIRTQAEIQTLLEQRVSAALGGVDLTGGPEHQVIGILAEELAIAWEALQAIHGAWGDEASGILLDKLAAITGTKRRAATHSRVAATVNLNAGITLPAGSQAAVDGNPDAVFELVEDVENTGGAPDDIDAVFEALETGPVASPAGSLTQIVTPVSGWNSLTNAAAADPLGRDVALDPELRTQRRIELAGAGAGPVAATRAAVAEIEEILEVQVFENTSMVVDADGRPPKSIEAVIWDGAAPAADDDEVAQAIWDKKGGGIEAHGVGSSGMATDALTGQEHTVEFTRASQLNPTIVATVVLEPGTAAGWEAAAEQAIVDRGGEYLVGEDAYASQLICALQEVPGIAAVITLTIDGGASLVADYDEIVRVQLTDVAVTEAP